jgi:hypothetical protein
MNLRSYIILLAFSLFGVLLAQTEKIKFEKTTHDFGTITQGVPPEYTFSFKNVSNAPLALKGVSPAAAARSR